MDAEHAAGPAFRNSLLFRVAEASLSQPEGVVKEVVYPVVGEETLRDLVAEWQASGRSLKNQVQTVICNSYRSYYRRMLPKLLDALEFRSNVSFRQGCMNSPG